MADVTALLAGLSHFDAGRRHAALKAILELHPAAPAETLRVNMHMHTFFSYNGEDWSPTRLAWEARQQGLHAAGICDFDVLAGLHEFLEAGDLLGLRAAVGFETRTFFREYASQEINSPGEPGVFYFMGVGFRREPDPGTRAHGVLIRMLHQSHQRNRDLIARINGQLTGLSLDYDADVLPLTPAGNATERHIVKAYFDKALAKAAGDTAKAAEFWGRSLAMKTEEMVIKIKDVNGFVDMLRSKMMKKGGLGYAQPTEATFPALDDVIAMILECEAVPTSTWLDGTCAGESDPGPQLECLIAKGVAAANIIPDRNWNIKDPVQQERKVRELHRYAKVAAALDLPVLVGTEMNKPGQRFVDDFEAAPMKPLARQFIDGAQVLVGHQRFLRYADFSYVGKHACHEYPARARRNQVFGSVGALPGPTAETRKKLDGMPPVKAFSYLHDCARRGEWI